MNIRQAAAFAGISVKTARYYSDISLVAVQRDANNYRCYSQQDAVSLRFVAEARRFDFSLRECRHLLSLWKNPIRARADVKTMVLTHVNAVEKEIDTLVKLRDKLKNIAATCPGDAQPDCPILSMLALGFDSAEQ